MHAGLKEGGRGISGSQHRVQRVFIVAEVAMALVLLTGAGLMLRSLARLWSVDPGFNPHGILTMGLSLPRPMKSAAPQAIRAAFREFDDKVASIPGVQAVSQTWGAAPMGGDDEWTFWLEGQPKPQSENEMNWAIDYIVEPAYLKAMGIKLQRGRFFTDQDNEHSRLVMVVDDVFARKFFANQDPIGKRILSGSFDGPAEIVGVVGHVKQWGLDTDETEKLRAQIYFPCMQMRDSFIAMQPSGSQVFVRSDKVGLADSIRRVSQQMSSEQVLFGMQTMNQVIAESLAGRRFSMILFAVFAGLALLLASVGLYGVISYFVGQRTHEIGVRMALGAKTTDVLGLVVGQGLRLTLTGVGIGVLAAMGVTRFLSSLLYGVKPSDPLTFVGVSLVLMVVGLLACYLPARRAARVDPMVALRYE